MQVGEARADIEPELVPAMGIEQCADGDRDVPRAAVRKRAFPVRLGEPEGDLGPDGEPIRRMPNHTNRRGHRDRQTRIAFVLRPRAGRRKTPERDSDYAHLPSRHYALSLRQMAPVLYTARE